MRGMETLAQKGSNNNKNKLTAPQLKMVIE